MNSADGSSWRCAVGDIPIRLMIMRRTQEVFRSVSVPCEPEAFEESLCELVPRLERELYRTAHTLEEYGDPSTVRYRLEQLAPKQAHVKPLEALWLQGLFANISEADGDDSTESQIFHTTETHSDPISKNCQTGDTFTRSLIQLQEILDRYDAFSSTITVDESGGFVRENKEGGYLDLRCYEAREDAF